MAVVANNEYVRRIAAALGLERCRSAMLRMATGEIVTVVAEQFVDAAALAGLATELETHEYALVPKVQWDAAEGELERLRSLTRFQDRVIRSGDTATLTEEEREALATAAGADGRHEKVLLGLLERLA